MSYLQPKVVSDEEFERTMLKYLAFTDCHKPERRGDFFTDLHFLLFVMHYKEGTPIPSDLFQIRVNSGCPFHIYLLDRDPVMPVADLLHGLHKIAEEQPCDIQQQNLRGLNAMTVMMLPFYIPSTDSNPEERRILLENIAALVSIGATVDTGHFDPSAFDFALFKERNSLAVQFIMRSGYKCSTCDVTGLKPEEEVEFQAFVQRPCEVQRLDVTAGNVIRKHSTPNSVVVARTLTLEPFTTLNRTEFLCPLPQNVQDFIAWKKTRTHKVLYKLKISII